MMAGLDACTPSLHAVASAAPQLGGSVNHVFGVWRMTDGDNPSGAEPMTPLPAALEADSLYQSVDGASTAKVAAALEAMTLASNQAALSADRHSSGLQALPLCVLTPGAAAPTLQQAAHCWPAGHLVRAYI
jgi:hypothetical protein